MEEKVLYEVKRIEVWPIVKIGFVISVVLGFILGLMSSLMIVAFSNFLGTVVGESFVGSPKTLSGGLAIVGAFFWAPIYGVIGAFLTAISVWIYNLIARWAGGVRLNLKLDEGVVSSAEVRPRGREEGV